MQYTQNKITDTDNVLDVLMSKTNVFQNRNTLIFGEPSYHSIKTDDVQALEWIKGICSSQSAGSYQSIGTFNDCHSRLFFKKGSGIRSCCAEGQIC
jgi:hypothetical protein